MRILVVDDEPLSRSLVTHDLVEEGYGVIEAANAIEAINLLLSGTAIDLLITDVDMPGEIDGLGLATFVRRTCPHTKVIVVSGRDAPRSAPSADFDMFIGKPVTSRLLRRQVGMALQGC